jgi:hypothetical protein
MTCFSSLEPRSFALPNCLEVRACYPFPFDRGLFWAFMEAWMEDCSDILTEIGSRKLSQLSTEKMH